jgi:autotransporter translocation and assembly factor TamB
MKLVFRRKTEKKPFKVSLHWHAWPLRYKILSWILLIGTIVFFSGYLIIRSPLVQNYIREQIIEFAQKNLDSNLVIGDISGNPFSYLRLRNIQFHGPYQKEAPQNKIFADDVLVRFSLWQLMQGKIGFSSIRIQSPKVYLDIGCLMKHPSERPVSGRKPFNLNWLDVSKGNVTLAYEGREYDFQNANLKGLFSMETGVTNIRVRDFSGMVEGLKIDQLRGRVSLSPTGIEAKSIHIRGKDIQLDADGTVRTDVEEGPLLKLEAKSDKLPVGTLLEWLPTKKRFPANGETRFNISLDGPIDNLQGKGYAFSSKGEINGMPFTDLSLRFSIHTSHIKISEASINILKGNIKASAETTLERIRDGKSQSTTALSLQTSRGPAIEANTYILKVPFKLQAAFQNLDATLIPKVDPRLSGLLSGQLKLTGNLLEPTRYKGTGSLRWDKGVYHGITNLTGKTELVIDGDNLKFTDSRFTTPEMDAKGKIDILRLAQKNPRIDFLFDWISRDLSKQRQFLNLPETTGSGKGQIHGFSDRFEPLKVEGKFSLDNGKFATLKYNHVDGTIYADRRLEIKGSRLTWLEDWPIENADVLIVMGPVNSPQITNLTFQKILARNQKTQVTGSGFVDFKSQKMQFKYTTQNAYMEDLPGIRKFVPPLNGSLDLNGGVGGWGDNIVVVNKFVLKEPRLWSASLPHPMTGEVTVDPRKVIFGANGTGYWVKGAVDYKRQEAQVDVNGNLQDLHWKAKGLEGKLSGSFQANGKTQNIMVQGSLRNFDTKFGKAFPLKVPAANLAGQLQKGLSSGQFNVKLSSTDAALGKTPWKTGPANMNLHWVSNQPVQMAIQANEGSIGAMPVSNIESAMVLDISNHLEISDLRFKTQPAGAADLKGLIVFANNKEGYKINFAGTGMPLNPILHTWNPDLSSNWKGQTEIRASLTGRGFDFDGLSGNGNFKVLKMDMQGASDKGFLSRIKLGDVNSASGQFTIRDGVLQLAQGKLDFPKSDVDVSGKMGPGGAMDFKFSGELASLGIVIDKTTGKTDFNIRLKGTSSHPQWDGQIKIFKGGYAHYLFDAGVIDIDLNDSLKGTVKGSFDKFKVGTQTFDSGNVILSMEDPWVVIKEAKLSGKLAQAALKGKYNTKTEDMNLSLDASNIILTRWLASNSENWLADSKLDVGVDYEGNARTGQGRLVLNRLEGNSGYSLLKLENPVRLSMVDNRLDIPSLVLNSYISEKSKSNGNGKKKTSKEEPPDLVRSGTLKINGNILLWENKTPSYDLTFVAQNFSWPILKDTQAVYDTRLRLKDERGKAKLSGNMVFDRLVFTSPLFIDTRAVATPGKFVSLPEMPFNIDMVFSADSAIYFKNELLSLEAKGWIRLLTNEYGELEITHELKTLGGAVNYRGKEFPITKADVRHSDPRIFNPYIEAQAQTRVRNIDIFLRVFGTLNNYDISLTSDPPYPQTDLLALLATGRTVVELKEMQKQDIPSEVAVGYASEQILNTIGSPVVKAVGIDNVAMEYDEVDNENKLKIQKNLGKKVSVGYSLGLSKESNSNAQAEYKLNKKLSVVGRIGVNSVTKEASGALDLEFKIPTK